MTLSLKDAFETGENTESDIDMCGPMIETEVDKLVKSERDKLAKVQADAQKERQNAIAQGLRHFQYTGGLDPVIINYLQAHPHKL